MRMIYCVRTAMVTLSTSTNTTAAAITKPELEKNILFDEHRSELSGTVNEARRPPEVTDDDISSGPDSLLSPTVDAWKATIKDNKVVRLDNLLDCSQIHGDSLYLEKTGH